MESLSKTGVRTRKGNGNTFLTRVILARKGLPAYAPLILVSILALVAAMVEAYFVNADVLEYQCYATTFWYGPRSAEILPQAQCQSLLKLPPLQTLPREYPPLALVIFSLPLIGPVSTYALLFALSMGLAAAFIFWLLLRYGSPGAGFVFAVLLVLGCLGTAFGRFDMVPAALTLASLVLAMHKRWTLAFISLALGTLTKLFPLVLFPLLFLAEQLDRPGFFSPESPITLKAVPSIFLNTFRDLRKWHWKNAAIFWGLLVGVTAFFILLNSKGALSPFTYLYLRPLEIESVGSALIWLASFLGAPLGWVTSFGSLNTVSPLNGPVSQGMFILLCVAYAYIFAQLWTRKMGLAQACLAALLVLLATSKVFSPQYLLWLIPILSFTESGNRRLLLYWGGISVLTSLIYPVDFGIQSITGNPALVPGFLPAILLRNAGFVLLTLAYLFDWARLRSSAIASATIQEGLLVNSRPGGGEQ